MADGDGVGAGGKGFAAEIGEEAGEFVLVELVEFWAGGGAGVQDVFAEKGLGDLMRGVGGVVVVVVVERRKG